MKKHPYRTVLIWAAIVVALINIYPTIGWMTLEEDQEWLALPEAEQAEQAPRPGTRQARLEKWKEEDIALAREQPGPFGKMWHQVKRWAEFDRTKVINLGLDLQGGIHMVLSFDWQELPEERIQEYRDDMGYDESEIQQEVQDIVLQQIRRRIHDFEAKEPVIQALGDDMIQVQLPGEKDTDRARRLITKTALLNFHIVSGVDESAPVFLDIQKAFPEDFAPPFIERPQYRGAQIIVPAQYYDHVREVIQRAQREGVVPEGKTIAFSAPPKPWEEDQDYELYLMDAEPIASGEGLSSATAIPDQTNPPYWEILFSFNAVAGAQFAEVTEANIGNPMAIVLDGVVVSAPVIQDRIPGRGRITGSFDGPQARDLAIALNSGSMVVPIEEEFTRVVGASLGADSVRRGVTSALVGIALVSLFMVAYYHLVGVIALAGLVLDALFVVAAMAYFGMTLTLPGIAGLILTVGMAVDANVLIFERIREELKLGHSLASSVENGFTRATVTILDANVTTLIAAAVLFQFGTGPIEGFAVTLSIGVCASVFVALVACRAMADWMVERHVLKQVTMLSIIRSETKIPFLSGRTVAAVVSAAVIILGLVVFGMRGKENLGVDFTQGTNILLAIQSEEYVEVGDLREALGEAGFESPVIQRSAEGVSEGENQFLIRVAEVNELQQQLGAKPAEEEAAPAAAETPQDQGGDAAPEAAPSEAPAQDGASAETQPAEGEPEDGGAAAQEAGGGDTAMTTVAGRIQQALAPFSASGAAQDVRVLDEQTVGPAVGQQLAFDALKAIFWALVFIVVYLTLRFELKFAAGAVVALTHDVLVTVGVFALLGRQLTMPVVAALLTIIGYSLNDTIVVFDRIRENLATHRGKGYKFVDILNMAINDTLSRTLLTSLTTLFVVVVLYTFGGDAINDFALALILGVIVGTYSSVFIASPVVYLWQRVQGKHVQPGDTGKAGEKGAKKGRGGGKSKRRGAST